MACLPCVRGFHDECDKVVTSATASEEDYYEKISCCCPKEEATPQVSFSESITVPTTAKRGRPVQAEIGISAGRKRAAEIYGNETGSDKPCEWRFMANCGGGLYPIAGCAMGTREHIHHGPVKDTGHNERSNISLICTLCHNRWHAKNNPVYNEEAFGLLPKQHRLMTIEECLEAIADEVNRKKIKSNE